MNEKSGTSLEALLRPSGINLDLKNNDRDSVLEELVDQIEELKSDPNVRATLLKALREREQLHSTGIGDGIALPHARNALVGLISHPVIVFGRHKTGIPYGSIDNVPARLFFLLIAPTVTQHLGIIARLSRVLRDARTREALLAADKPQKVIQVIGDAEKRVAGPAPASG
jgi:mannitol/fructose-specific phosphotransferase system IIA component (Ntr-type)